MQMTALLYNNYKQDKTVIKVKEWCGNIMT